MRDVFMTSGVRGVDLGVWAAPWAGADRHAFACSGLTDAHEVPKGNARARCCGLPCRLLPRELRLGQSATVGGGSVRATSFCQGETHPVRSATSTRAFRAMVSTILKYTNGIGLVG